MIAIVAELSFDNTNSFVRVFADESVGWSERQVGSDANGSCEVRSSDDACRKEGAGRTVSLHSLGHHAVAPADFDSFVPEAVDRIDVSFVWTYRSIERFALLRPPIRA